MKKLVIIFAIVFGIVWNIQAFDDFKNELVEMVIIGKIPWTQVYMGFTATLALGLFFVFLLFRWLRQLNTDFLDFSLEMNRRQQAMEAERLLVEQDMPKVAVSAQSLGDEELDLLSV